MFSGYVLVHYIVRIQYNGVILWTNGLGWLVQTNQQPPKKSHVMTTWSCLGWSILSSWPPRPSWSSKPDPRQRWVRWVTWSHNRAWHCIWCKITVCTLYRNFFPQAVQVYGRTPVCILSSIQALNFKENLNLQIIFEFRIFWQHSPSMDKIWNSLTKALVASLADERSFPAVDSLVVLQSRQLFEGLSTVLPGAGVRLLVSVVEHVLVERLLERKGFPT